MKNVKGNMFELRNKYDVLCITTNGFVKSNYKAVMGAGCAKYARDNWKGIDDHLGQLIAKKGNHVHGLGKVGKTAIFSFPVKHNWWEKADINLIEQSAIELLEKVGDRDLKIVIPRPGCGNGKLNWEKDVQPILAPILDDRFEIITFDKGE